jgi:UDP-N-acetylmuramoylalanine--D-glutamate ligase
VVGLGVTGLSCARYFAQCGEMFSVVDSRLQPPALAQFKTEFPNATLALGVISDSSLAGATQLVVSPGVSLAEPAIARAIAGGAAVCGDIDLFCREVTAPVVAISGSNGKSTVTTLLGLMAASAGRKVAVGGNLGRPALDLLSDVATDLYVLELSSFQLERAGRLGVAVATVLNISDDHLDRYDSPASYHRAKQRIFLDCQQLVINRGDQLSQPPSTAALNDLPCWSFGLDTPSAKGFGVLADSEGALFLAFEHKLLMPVSALKLAGSHNLENALAALALGWAAGLEMAPMLQALRDFPGLEHRCQWVRQLEAVQYVNDSKGTNVGAVIASVLGLSAEVEKIVLIAGGESKGADFSPLLPVLAQHVRALVLIGEATVQIEGTVQSVVATHRAQSMVEAVTLARQVARPGDCVLLSPACASFDMFDNYMQRGTAFCDAVAALADGGERL